MGKAGAAFGKKLSAKRVTAAIAAVTVVGFGVLSALSFGLKSVNYRVVSDKISQQMRIVQISDLHSCSYGKDMATLISAIDQAAPDVIVLTGDIYDDVVDNTNTSVLLKNIGNRYPCFYVAGNHEFHTEDWAQRNKAEAEGFGITVLEGENVDLGGGVTLCGAARSTDGSIGWTDCVERCAENAGQGFNLLLCHFPEDIDCYRSFGKFDLILCGHAHGGQWRIPFSQNGLYAPGQGLFPKYSGGRFDFGECTMIVSRGLSRTKEIVPRILNNPELVVIDLVPAEN